MVPQSVIKTLFGRANRCAFPSCSQMLVYVDDRGVQHNSTPVGEVAHIRSAKLKGPRYDSSYPTDQLDQEPNLLVLCGTHHSRGPLPHLLSSQRA